MTFPDINWAIHVTFLISISIFVCSIICGTGSNLFLNWTKRFEPQSKIILLRIFMAFPLLGGLIIGLMASLPSIGHISGLPLDHCHGTGGCFSVSTTHFASKIELSIVAAFLAFTLIPIVKVIAKFGRSYLLTKRILNSSTYNSKKDVHLIQTSKPLAFSIGFFNPITVLSSGLITQITAEQLEIVMTHEKTHAIKKDNFFKLVFSFLNVFHWTSRRTFFADEHSHAMELRSDFSTARTHANPLAVAQAIVSIQRVFQKTTFQDDAIFCHFTGTKTEQRIQFLLGDNQGREIRRTTLIFCSLISTMFVGFSSVPFHNFLETVISSDFF